MKINKRVSYQGSYKTRRGETLANIAHKLELYKWVQMDEKGMRNQWNKNPKILEDVFESIVGAIYHRSWFTSRKTVYIKYIHESRVYRFKFYNGRR